MNILSIGLDYTLAMATSEVMGDSQKRHIMYAKHVKSLHIVVQCLKKPILRKQKLAENLVIYPTNSFSRMKAVYDSYRIANRICKDHQIDLITTQDAFTCGVLGYLLKGKYGLPLNIQMHADFLDNLLWIKERKQNYIFNKLGKWLTQRADTIRVVSSQMKEKIVKMGICRDKIWFIPTGGGIEMPRFLNADGSNIKKNYLNQGYDTLILFVGRLTKQKDIPNLFQAIIKVIKEYPKALFLIVGRGEEEAQLKSLALKLKISDNALFIGEIPYNKIPSCFKACDIFVLPSIYEGTARVLEEASAAGKPIVTTNVSGAEDVIINGKTGFIVPINDSENLAEKIIYLLKNRELAKKMGKEGQKHVMDNYDQEKNLPVLIKMWEETARHKT